MKIQNRYIGKDMKLNVLHNLIWDIEPVFSLNSQHLKPMGIYVFRITSKLKVNGSKIIFKSSNSLDDLKRNRASHLYNQGE